MIITFHEGSFKIQTSGVVLFTESLHGKTSARHKADVYIKITDTESDIGATHTIKGPGEYEIQGVQVRGFPPYTYTIRAEKMKLSFISNDELSEETIDSDTMEQLMDADILFAPATPKSAQVIRQMQPRSVIITSGEANILEKELGLTAEKSDKYTVKKKDLSDLGQGRLRLIVLSA